MKLYFYFSFLILLINIRSESDCEKIKPMQYTDCKLSAEDKKRFKHCCYKNDKFGKECFAFDEYDYKIVESLNSENYYGNVTEFKCNSSFLKLGILFFILCLF